MEPAHPRSSIYKALRKKKDPKPTKAVVAARFDNCRQSLSDFCSIYEAVRPQNAEQVELAQDSMAQFVNWGKDTGAFDQTLDRKLRNASELREETLMNLNTLHQQLQDSIDIGRRLQQLNSSIQRYDIDLSDGEHAIDPDEVPLSVQQTKEMRAEIERFEATVDFLSAVVESLKLLGPSLKRPYPRDLDEMSSNADNGEAEVRSHIDKARKLFPRASAILTERLGRASYRRALALSRVNRQAELANRARHAKKQRSLHTNQGSGGIAMDVFQFQKPNLAAVGATRDTMAVLPKKNPAFHMPPAAASISTAARTTHFSDDSSLFSRPFTRVNSATSYEPSEYNAPDTEKGRDLTLHRFQLPEPPVSLDPRSCDMFTCPYCGFDYEGGRDIEGLEEWEHHVYEDLEPYLCTFDQCPRARVTYPTSAEWFNHEKEIHRAIMVWLCELCDREFPTKMLLKNHFLEIHSDYFDRKTVNAVIRITRPSVSRDQVNDQKCPLCQITCDESTLEDHISDHLEQLALAIVADEESSEDGDAEETFSIISDDLVSERGTKLAVLGAFVEEQLGITKARGLVPPDANLEDNDTAFMDDSDNESRPSQFGTGPRRDELRDWKVDRLLGSPSSSQNAAGQPWTTVKGADVQSRSSHTGRHSLPCIRTWPYPRNDEFVGREHSLGRLYRVLSEPGRVCALYGDAGLGKTALAVEYTYRYEPSYHYIFWVQAGTLVGARDTFCQIALQLKLAPQDSEQELLVRVGREFLEDPKSSRWLLVLDSLENWLEIEDCLPTRISKTNGSILVTTRKHDVAGSHAPNHYYRVPIVELDRGEGKKFLLSSLPEDLRQTEEDEIAAGEIASQTGVPLTLALIAGYVKASGLSLLEFYDYLKEWSSDKLTAGSRGDEFDSILTMALRDLHGDALNLLRIMVILDCNGIQRELLVGDRNSPSYLKPVRLRRILHDLAQNTLIELIDEEREVYLVHRRLQTRLLEDMKKNPEQRETTFRLAFDLIRKKLPTPSMDTPEPSKWGIFKELLPHVLRLEKIFKDPLAKRKIKPFVELAELFRDGGVALWQRYVANDAAILLRTAEEMLKEIEGNHEDLRAEINYTITLIFQNKGISQRREDMDRFQSILAYRQRIFDEKKPEDITRDDEGRLFNAKADYANAILALGNYAEAEPIYEQCRETLIQWGQDEHQFSFAKLHHHMAFCKLYQRDFDSAISLAQQSVDMVKKLGHVHSQLTARYEVDLACILLQAGDIKAALEIQNRILASRTGLKGKACYFTMQSLYAVASLLWYLDDLDEAENLMRAALQKSVQRGVKGAWPEPAVARCQYHLAQVIIKKNGGTATPEADSLLKESKSVLSKLLAYDPLKGVKGEDTLALFDHLQPLFGGRFTGTQLLKYYAEPR